MGIRFQGPKMARVFAFFAFLIHSSLGCGAVNERSRRSTALPDHGERSLLHRDLMEGYEKDVIPMEAAPNADNDANAVVFNLGASVIRMDMKNLESDELKPVLEMTSWLRMSWMDFRLKWNPEAYGGISQIRLPASKVWIPDIEVFSAEDLNVRNPDLAGRQTDLRNATVSLRVPLETEVHPAHPQPGGHLQHWLQLVALQVLHVHPDDRGPEVEHHGIGIIVSVWCCLHRNYILFISFHQISMQE